MDESVRRLDLRFATFEGRPDQPVVTVLIDGEDVFAGTGTFEGFVGFDPREILDTGALVPTEPPRRVAVYRCECGEPGCGCVAPVIRRDGDRVIWSDPRDYVGVFVAPIYGHGSIKPEGRRHGFADVVFDADQYLEEVERASRDGSWGRGAL